MKIALKILAIISFFLMLILGCQDKTEDDPILTEATNIIKSYSGKANFSCSFVEDALIYPEPWTAEAANTFTITEDEVKNVSTCGLIQTFFNQPWNVLGPWCNICSNLSIDGIQYFNDRVNHDMILTELFSRKEALNQLTGKYVGIIQDLTSMERHPGYLFSFEMLLASDQMSRILTESACRELMILALRMIYDKKNNTEFNNENSIAITRHILLNILVLKEFEPFLAVCSDNGSLKTFLMGYNVCYNNEKVEKYSEMYLKTK